MTFTFPLLFIYLSAPANRSCLYMLERVNLFGVVHFPLEQSIRFLIDSKVSHELLDSEIERKDRGNNARHFAHTKLLKSVTSCANNQVRWKTKNKLFILPL